MLKEIIAKIRKKANQGIFKGHFIGQIIENKDDKEAFYVYYQDRLAAIALSSLLDLDFSADGNEFTATSPITGKSATMSFYFAPPFKPTDNEISFETDIKNLVNFEDFLIEEIKVKFPNAPKFNSFFEAQHYIFTYLVASSNSNDPYKIQKLNELLTCSKNRLFLARPETTCMDQDIVMCGSWRNLNYISRIIQSPNKWQRTLSDDDIIRNMNDVLFEEFHVSLEERNNERVFAFEHSDDEKRTKKSGFWEYKKVCDNFAKSQEMW